MNRPTKPQPRGDRPRLALVLSGGGARGAYEAGILRYIREDLAGDLGGHAQFDILCGTSVGGIHACFVAGTCDMPARQGRMLAERWESMVLEELVAFGIKDFMRAPATLLGSGHIEEIEKGEKRLGGVVDTRQLERMVRRLTPWGRITPNCQAGFFESLSVALPILFPAIAVGERFYCDGGLRQNTPLSPALRLGADKVLVVGLRHKPPENEVAEESMPFPGAAFLAGKILNAFLLDHIDYDLDRLRRFNALIEAARSVDDEEHRKRFDEVTTQQRGAPYRVVGEMMIRPSVDLGEIAGDIARSGRFKGTGGGPGIRLLRRLAGASGASEADLLSYILFDGNYAAELVRMGYEDARARHDELARFLQDTVVHRDWD
jgi:NTE family protein